MSAPIIAKNPGLNWISYVAFHDHADGTATIVRQWRIHKHENRDDGGNAAIHPRADLEFEMRRADGTLAPHLGLRPEVLLVSDDLSSDPFSDAPPRSEPRRLRIREVSHAA